MKRLTRGAALTTASLLIGSLCQAAETPADKAEMVIVPYDATKPIQGQKPDQFYLPYERFMELWQAAKEHREGPKPEDASEAFVISAARYDGTVNERSFAFTGKLDVSTYNKPWVSVPLLFKDVKIGALKLDGAPASFDENHILIEKPGRHTLEVAFEIPRRPGLRSFAWNVPRASATLVSVTLPDALTTAAITPGSGIIERNENGHTLVTSAVGAAERIRVDLHAAASARVTSPAVAAINTAVTIRPGIEESNVKFAFTFPGGTQDRFTVYLENGLTLFGLDAQNLKSWKLSPSDGRQALEVTLNEPAKEAFSFSLQAQRPLPPSPADLTALVFAAAAKRLDYTGTALIADERLDVTPKPAAGQRQIPWNGAACANSRLIAAYAGAGKLSYSAKLAAPRREARVNYVYQVNRRKIELLASLQLFSKGEDLSEMTLTLPAQFEVRAVESERLQDWWRAGDMLHLRFRGATPEVTPLVVYLARQYAAAPTALEVRPLTLEGFARVTGEAVVAAHKGVDVAMKLTAEGSEISAEKAATDFKILPPLERKRGFTFKTQKFAAEVALLALSAKLNALWVMHAQAHEGWLALSTHARITVRQGSIDRASFSMPKSAPEGRVTGAEVRETRSRIEGERRVYEVQFQNDVYDSVEFSLDLEMPDPEEAELPAIKFPDAPLTTGFVLTENVSEYEMHLKTSGVDPATATEVPFLPVLTKGAGVFRVQPEWSVRIGLDRLEKAASRAAFVAWAEMTSALRGDGTEWHRASYHLQNRSLQFLPVRMPQGAELISVRVAEQAVRADSGQVDGRETLLVPLIKTKPGDLSYDVELVYRLSGPQPGWRAKREFTEPELPGITIERTLWNVWLPDNRTLEHSGGNMEPVLGDLNKTEKLEGKIQELNQLVTIANSSNISEEARQNARSNWGKLKQEVERDNRDQEFMETNGSAMRGKAPKPTPGDEAVGRQALERQGEYVANKRKEVNEELGRQGQKLAEVQMLQNDFQKTPSSNAAYLGTVNNGNAQTQQTWALNSTSALNFTSNAQAPVTLTKGGNGNLFFNDNVVLENANGGVPQKEAGKTHFVSQPGMINSDIAGKGEQSATSQKKASETEQVDKVLQTARGNNLRYQQRGEEAAKPDVSSLQRQPQANFTGSLEEKMKAPAALGSTSTYANNRKSAAMPSATPVPMQPVLGSAGGSARAKAMQQVPGKDGGTLSLNGVNTTISGANTYSGGTTLNSGVTIVSGGTLTVPTAPNASTMPSGTPPAPAAAPPGGPAMTPQLSAISRATSSTSLDALSAPAIPNTTIGSLAPAAEPTGGGSVRPPGASFTGAASESAESEAKRLQPTGRISLAVEFPTEGQLYHFKKVKANARLELTVMKAGVFARWRNLAIALVLAGALLGVQMLLDRRAAARRYGG